MSEYTFVIEIVDTEYNQDFLTLYIKADVKFKDITRGKEIKQLGESLNKINSELEVSVDDERSMIAFRMPFEVGYSELLENDPKEVLNNYASDFEDLIKPIFQAIIYKKVNKIFGDKFYSLYRRSFFIEI